MIVKIKVAIEDRYEKWPVNTSSAQIPYAPAYASHLQLVAGRSILSHGENTPSSSPTPASSSDAHVTRMTIIYISGQGKNI